MTGICAIAADLIVVLHFLVVLFVVGSQVLIMAGWFFGWQWIRALGFRLTHLCLVGFIACQSLIGQLCPLTVWEYYLRRCAGQTVESEMPFLARLIRPVLYHDLPVWFFNTIYVVFGVLVIMTFVMVPPAKPAPRQKHRR